MQEYLIIPQGCETHDLTLILGDPLDEGGSPVIGYYCPDCDRMEYVPGACPDCHQVGDHHGFNCQLTWI